MRRSSTGIHRARKTKVSDAQIGHCWSSWISSQSRHMRALRSCTPSSVLAQAPIHGLAQLLEGSPSDSRHALAAQATSRYGDAPFAWLARALARRAGPEEHPCRHLLLEIMSPIRDAKTCRRINRPSTPTSDAESPGVSRVSARSTSGRLKRWPNAPASAAPRSRGWSGPS